MPRSCVMKNEIRTLPQIGAVSQFEICSANESNVEASRYSEMAHTEMLIRSWGYSELRS